MLLLVLGCCLANRRGTKPRYTGGRSPALERLGPSQAADMRFGGTVLWIAPPAFCSFFPNSPGSLSVCSDSFPGQKHPLPRGPVVYLMPAMSRRGALRPAALTLMGDSESPVLRLPLTVLFLLPKTPALSAALGCLCPRVKVLFFTRCCFCR